MKISVTLMVIFSSQERVHHEASVCWSLEWTYSALHAADAAAAKLRVAAGGAATVHALRLDLASRPSIEAAAAHLRCNFNQQASQKHTLL